MESLLVLAGDPHEKEIYSTVNKEKTLLKEERLIN